MWKGKRMIFLSSREGILQKVYGEERMGDAPVLTPEDVFRTPEKWSDTRFIFTTWGMEVFTQAEIQALFPKLEAVFYAAGSVQRFARPFLSNGVRIFSAWAANAVPVAEFTVAQILLASKGYFRLPKLYSEQGWDAAVEYSTHFPGNFDVRIGLLGAGKIGRHVISLLKPYRLEVLVFDPFLPEAEAEALGVQKADLQTIFATCQTISNHLANNEKTQGIIDYALLSSMLPYATFINTGRGAQVDEEAMLRAFREERGRTALLDVTTEENLKPGHPLLSEPNILVSPHRAGSLNKEVRRMGDMMMDAYSDYLAGRPSDCEVTLPMLETMA